MANQLAKSEYLDAQRCIKRLWYEVQKPELVNKPDLSQLRLRSESAEVGRLARQRFPGGILIKSKDERCLVETQTAIKDGARVLYDAAFVYDDVHIRCDILRKNRDGRWDVIEVKTASRLNKEYITDMAVQLYVLNGIGMAVRALKLMYVNATDCTYPKLENYFRIVDVTAEVEPEEGEVKSNLKVIRKALRRKNAPDAPIGPHCMRPDVCPLKSLCWRNVPDASVFTIPQLSAGQITELLDQGIVSVKDVPARTELTHPQRSYVKMMIKRAPRIFPGGVRSMLSELRWPVYFLDFETVGFAVPRYSEMHPFQPAPFQYSLHRLHKNGRLEHCDYLHMNEDDPRPPMAAQLAGDIHEDGSIVVFNARQAKRVLTELAVVSPKTSRQMISAVDRLWDQRLVFVRYYNDPGFLGSMSLRSILSVLAPEFSYEDLVVQKGDISQAVWQRMLLTDDKYMRLQLAADLRDYCRRDTYAMVEIHRSLVTMLRTMKTLVKQA